MGGALMGLSCRGVRRLRRYVISSFSVTVFHADAVIQAGHVGGLHAHGEKAEDEKDKEKGRREDGTFKPDSEAAEDVSWP